MTFTLSNNLLLSLPPPTDLYTLCVFPSAFPIRDIVTPQSLLGPSIILVKTDVAGLIYVHLREKLLELGISKAGTHCHHGTELFFAQVARIVSVKAVKRFLQSFAILHRCNSVLLLQKEEGRGRATAEDHQHDEDDPPGITSTVVGAGAGGRD